MTKCSRFAGCAALLAGAVWLSLAGTVAAGDLAERAAFERVVEFHLDRYPVMQVDDLYKLVFQAAMGSEHAAPSREAAEAWLERELATLEVSSSESLIEPLSPDGTLVRVNLRQLVLQHGDPGRLLDAFLGTAATFEGSRENLARYWRWLEAMASHGRLPFAVSRLQEMWARMESSGLPAVHHSRIYRDRYQPAYRVVLLELLGPDFALPIDP